MRNICNARRFLLYRKTDDDDAEGEAYYRADKAFLEGMIAQREDELEGK